MASHSRGAWLLLPTCHSKILFWLPNELELSSHFASPEELSGLASPSIDVSRHWSLARGNKSAVASSRRCPGPGPQPIRCGAERACDAMDIALVD